MTDSTTTITLEIPDAVAHKLSETGTGTLADTALTALRLYHGIGHPARTALNAIAEAYNLTPARTLRLAIEHLQKDTARLQLTPTVGRPIVNTARDADIYSKTRQGITHATIAAEYGISIVRIGQIVAKQKALMRAKPLETFKLKSPEAQATLDTQPEPTPEPTPEAPRKLAVIPPSMKNPELLTPKPIKQIDPAKVDTSMFDDDFPI